MHDINFSHRIVDLDRNQYRDSITKAIYLLLEKYTRLFSKTMIVRFDVHYPKNLSFAGYNEDISELMKRLMQRCSRRGVAPCYFWVREQSIRADNPHYHCILLLDANKTRRYFQYLELAEKVWGEILNVEIPKGLINYCTKDYEGKAQENGIILRSDDPRYADNISTVIRQTLYLAKEYSKGLCNDGCRDFGMSRLNRIPLLRANYRSQKRSRRTPALPLHPINCSGK